jgi:hypothetical protein
LGGWGIGVLARGPDGEWMHRELTGGSGSPVAFGVEAGGAVDLLVIDDTPMPCVVETAGPRAFVLLRVDRDGYVTVRD